MIIDCSNNAVHISNHTDLFDV